MPPNTSAMYPSSISRALCSDGMRCIKPLAPSRNETNSSRVTGGADGAILGICSYGGRDQETSRIYLAALRICFCCAVGHRQPSEPECTSGAPGVSGEPSPLIEVKISGPHGAGQYLRRALNACFLDFDHYRCRVDFRLCLFAR